MHTRWKFVLVAGVIGLATSAFGESVPGNALETLRAELDALRSDYESRITDLESRLAIAEQKAMLAYQQAEQAAYSSQAQTAAGARSGQGVNSNAFNPAIGVIFQGQAFWYDQDPEEYRPSGFPLGGEAGLAGEGLSLGETEIDISANVDDKFTAWLTAAIVLEDGEAAFEIEEAWIETLTLPGGVSARFGRFFSNIGYLNSKHSHAWDFADQPLAYQTFLGNQYIDDGVQLRWLAPTDFYLDLGGEIMRGDRFPAGGARHSGFGAHSVFVRTGGDVGAGHSWQAGLSYLKTSSEGRESGPEETPLSFDGDYDLAIAEFVWKWAPNGNWKQRNFKLQAEYLWRSEKGNYLLPDGRNPYYDADQRGWYAQAIFQPVPRWRLGLRLDALAADDPGTAFVASDLDPGTEDPMRFSLMLDWSNSEFSRLRLQYNHDEAGTETDKQWGVQYIHSIGAHGAHSF